MQVGRYFVTTNTLNVRSSPNGSIIGKAYKGDYAIVSAWSDGFAKATINGMVGYLSDKYLVYLRDENIVNTLPDAKPPILETLPPSIEVLPPSVDVEPPFMEDNDTTVTPETLPNVTDDAYKNIVVITSASVVVMIFALFAYLKIKKII